jgi:predicted DCC family thiol-disulfide oxidoreductase YuxK
LHVLRGLGLPWSFLYVLIVVPRLMRDVVYRWIARNRYRWFGKRESCMVPTPDIRSRFLE